MKPTQQQKDNKAIAEFMGLTIITDNISYFDTNYKALKNYHSDWNWLMEVVEKIESLKTPITNNPNLIGQFEEYEVYIQCKHVVIYAHGEVTKEISNLKEATKIEAVYNACVEFIKWYNENK